MADGSAPPWQKIPGPVGAERPVALSQHGRTLHAFGVGELHRFCCSVVAVLVWPLLSGACSSSAETGGSGASGGAPAWDGAAASAGSGASAGAPGDIRDAGTDGAVRCSDDDRPAVVPPNWVRFPGISCDCEDIWVDPEPSASGPVGRWVPHEPGGVRLQLNDDTRISLGGRGDATVSRARVSFEIATPTSYDRDTVVVDMDTLVPDLRLRQAWDGASSDCSVHVSAMNEGQVYVRALDVGDDVVHASATSGVPIVRARRSQPSLTSRAAIGRGVMSWSLIARLRIDAASLVDGRLFEPALLSDTGSLTLHAASGDTLALDATTRILFWSPDRGERTVIGTELAWRINAFGTDGRDMVWTDAVGWDVETGTYDVVRLFTAPFSEDPDPSTFRMLRKLPHASSVWRVGGGYAAGRPTHDSLLVVRLSDGHLWRLPDQQGEWRTGGPAYVTAEELVYGAYADSPWAFTYVRVPLAELGPGTPPE